MIGSRQSRSSYVPFPVSATDLCDPSPVVVTIPTSGSVFLPGRTTVFCTATDASGNQTMSTFDVIVRSALRMRLQAGHNAVAASHAAMLIEDYPDDQESLEVARPLLERFARLAPRPLYERQVRRVREWLARAPATGP